MTETLLRRIFPRKSTCTNCGSTGVRGAVSNSRGGDLQYRTCRGCGERYSVAAIAVEVDAGGSTSTIRPA